MLAMAAGDKGVAALDLVNETVRGEKIEGAVDRHWGRAGTRCGEPLDDVAGAGRLATAGNGDEDLAAQAGQAAAAAGADPLGAGDEVAGTDVMIMIGGMKAAGHALGVHAVTM